MSSVPFESTTMPNWMSTTQTYSTSGNSDRSGTEAKKSSPISVVNFTVANTAWETNRVTTLSVSQTGNTNPVTKKPKKVTTRRPSSRLKMGQMSTTTEVVTENMFLLTTASSCMNVTEYKITDEDLMALNETDKNRLRKLCWETMFGQVKVLIHWASIWNERESANGASEHQETLADFVFSAWKFQVLALNFLILLDFLFIYFIASNNLTCAAQELVKLTVMDLVLVVASTLTGDFIRALIVRSVFGVYYS